MEFIKEETEDMKIEFIKGETEDMAIEFNKEEFEEIKIEETCRVKHEDTEEQTGFPETVPALVPAGVLSPPLESSRPEVAVEKGKDGTVWTILQSTEHPGRRQSQNVLTEAAGPTAHTKRNIEDALTAFLCGQTDL